MPRLALPNHDECRKLVCCICWNRAEKKISLTVAQGSELERGLKEFVDEDYDAGDLFISFKYSRVISTFVSFQEHCCQNL